MTYNTRSPAVKRLMKEAQELSKATELFYAKPLDDNLFEWHFTIRGPMETDYDGGIYHGRILLPAEYPMKPPNILLLTPSGRFEVNRKICLSISGYHPETWRPSWSIRTALLAIIGFMPTHGVGAIGSLEYPPEERRKLAKSSVDYVCTECGGVRDILASLTEASVSDVAEARDLAAQITFTGDKDGAEDKATKNTVEVQDTEVKFPPPAAQPSLPGLVCPMVQQPLWSVPPTLNASSDGPLSFEEWCRQSQRGAKDDASVSETALSSSNKEVVDDALGPVDPQSRDTSAVICPRITVDSDSHVTEIAPSPVPEAAVPIVESPPPTTNDNSNQPPSSRDTHNGLTMDSLRHRQTVLLHSMAVVAAILGLFLAVRLGSLSGVADTGGL